MYCQYCNKKITNKGGLSNHEKICKTISKELRENILLDYKNGISIKKLQIKYKLSKCIIIGILGNLIRSASESGIIAHKLYPEKFKLSEKTKQKIREKRINFLKSHPENTAWRQKNLSYPELCFLNLLKNEGLNKKYNIVREFSVFPYYIDFAFPDIKLAIEIDGSQHLLLEYQRRDKKKDELLQLYNWKIVRIQAKAIMYEYNKVKENLYNILNNLINNKNFKGFYINSEIKKQVELKLIEKEKQKEQKLKEKLEFIKQRKDLILRSNIDFSKFGWITKVSKLLNISHPQVRKWIKKYMYEFYIKSCWKNK